MQREILKFVLKRKMQDSNKNTGKGFRDFFRYRRNEMSGEERNAFERELQRDPFAEEAAEGLNTLSPEEARADLSELRTSLEKRINKRSRLTFFRIAASVAVLMLISTLIVLIQRSRSNDNAIPVTALNEPIEITSHEPLKEPPEQSKTMEKKAGIGNEQSKTNAETPDIRDKEISELISASDMETVKDMDSLQIADLQKPAAASKRSENESIPAKVPAGASLKNYHITGKIISSEDREPLAGASVTMALQGKVAGVMTDSYGNFNFDIPDSGTYKLTASFIGSESKVFAASSNSPVIVNLNPSVTSLSEIVVTALGIRREEAEEKGDFGKYSPPVPERGKSEFDRYLRDNIRRPDTLGSEKKLVVVLNFLVRKDGIVDSITVVRSPGKAFSDEAIRLLESGPPWQPAEDNGIKIDDQVRLRIIFRQEH
jgi:hypothetical protein